MITVISGRKEPGRIDSLVLDATLQDSHDFSNEVTDFPIEEGSNINDHIKKEPISISITGFITESPVTFIEEINNHILENIDNNEDNPNNPIKLNEVSGTLVSGAFSELMRIVGDNYPDQPTSVTVTPNNPKVVEVVTGLRVYSDMVMIKLNIRREPTDGYSLRFTATFKKITKVKRNTVPIGSLGIAKSVGGNATGIEDQADSTKKVGNQPTKKLKSIAKRISDSPMTKKIGDKVQDLVRTF